MADTVSSQTILDGERLFIGKFTCISDGTGETAVVKIDVSTLNPNAFGLACNGVKINKIWGSVHGMNVRVLFDATTDTYAWQVPQNTAYLMDFSTFGGLPSNAGAGVTGDVLFTTHDASAGDSYTIVIEAIKTYATS
jgi:predicted RNA-binding protein with TRAM domain